MDWSRLMIAGEGFVGGALGGTLTVASLSRWLGDLWLARILEKEKAKYGKQIEELKARFARELERYRSQLDHSVFVTRAHFETELEAYKKVFEGLGEVRLAISGTRPMMSVSRADETREDKPNSLAGRLEILVESHDKTLRIFENLSPFYPREIYLKVDECLRAARGEIVDLQTAGDETFTFEWFKQGQKRLDEFFPAYNAVTEGIRDRIATLSIIPG